MTERIALTPEEVARIERRTLEAHARNQVRHRVRESLRSEVVVEPALSERGDGLEELLGRPVGLSNSHLVDQDALIARVEEIFSTTIDRQIDSRVAEQLRELADEIESTADSRREALDSAVESVDGNAETLDSGIMLSLRIPEDAGHRMVELGASLLEVLRDALQLGLILAAHDGVVSRKWWDAYPGGAGAGGWMIEVRGDDGLFSRYAHMRTGSALSVGARVAGGQSVVGEVGDTGAATAAHLHFEVLRGGEYIDPVPLLQTLPPPATAESEDTMLYLMIIDNHGKYGPKDKRYFAVCISGKVHLSLTAADAHQVALTNLAGRDFSNTSLRCGTAR